MSDHLPFIDDPAHVALLEGQRYLVLRPYGEVSSAHAAVQSLVRARLPGLPVSYPARAHVTLQGFPNSTSLEHVQTFAASWAAGVPPLRIEVERLSVFPAPFKTVIIQVRKTPHLFRALSSARELAKRRGLPERPAGSVPSVDEWIFHMSVAYCSQLSDDDWSRVPSFIETLGVPSVACVVPYAELAAFDHGREYSGGLYPLSGPQTQQNGAV